ncbi:hypothetical protein JCM10449v2_003328 [Rhodotorula kratochvilovae]
MDQNEPPSTPTTLESLPDELLVLISEQLPHPLDLTVLAPKRDRRTLARLCRASKRWRDVVQPVLWHHVAVDSDLAIHTLLAADASGSIVMWTDLGQVLPNVVRLLVTDYQRQAEEPLQLRDFCSFSGLKSLHLQGLPVNLVAASPLPRLVELTMVKLRSTASVGGPLAPYVFPSLRRLQIDRDSLQSSTPLGLRPAGFFSQLVFIQVEAEFNQISWEFLARGAVPCLVMVSLSTGACKSLQTGIAHIELYDFPDFCHHERSYAPSLSEFEAQLAALASYITAAASTPNPVVSLSASAHFLASSTWRRARTAFDPVRDACTQHDVALRFVPVTGIWSSAKPDFAQRWAGVQEEEERRSGAHAGKGGRNCRVLVRRGSAEVCLIKTLLKKLSPAVYLAEPATAALNGAAAGGAAKAPELVLISSWMGAQLKHVEKYVETYRKLYPTSAILLLRSSEADFFRSSTLVRALSPAVDVLRARTSGYTAGPSSGLLVHAFSNGGCLTLKMLNELLRAEGKTDDAQPLVAAAKQLLARAIVLDSCPGLQNFKGTIAAFTAGVKSPFVKVPLVAILTVVFGALRLWDIIKRQPPILSRLSSYLNSSAFPAVPRLYLYSDIDKLVPCADVERHAAAARAAGVEVRTERFDGTPHVAHARVEPERYWGAIQEVWEKSGEK